MATLYNFPHTRDWNARKIAGHIYVLTVDGCFIAGVLLVLYAIGATFAPWIKDRSPVEWQQLLFIFAGSAAWLLGTIILLIQPHKIFFKR